MILICSSKLVIPFEREQFRLKKKHCIWIDKIINKGGRVLVCYNSRLTSLKRKQYSNIVNIYIYKNNTDFHKTEKVKLWYM